MATAGKRLPGGERLPPRLGYDGYSICECAPARETRKGREPSDWIRGCCLSWRPNRNMDVETKSKKISPEQGRGIAVPSAESISKRLADRLPPPRFTGPMVVPPSAKAI